MPGSPLQMTLCNTKNFKVFVLLLVLRLQVVIFHILVELMRWFILLYKNKFISPETTTFK